MLLILKKALSLTIIFACLAFATNAHAKKTSTKMPPKLVETKDTTPTEAAPVTDINTQEVKYVMTSNPSTEKFEDVTLVQTRTLVAADKSTELKRVSHGLRKKAVFGLVPVRVYTAELLAAHPEKLVRTEDGFLASLKQAGPVQLRLTFLRDLPGQKIADSFKEGLEANKIPVKNMSPELSQVMEELTAIKQFSKDTSFSITGVWTGDQSRLLLENPQEIKSINGSAALADNIFAIWFGKPSDGKLGELKKELIK